MTVTDPTIPATDLPDDVPAAPAAAGDDAAVEIVDDVLVEEISIDGMCGVY